MLGEAGHRGARANLSYSAPAMMAPMNTSDAQTAAMFTFEAQLSLVIRSIQHLLSELCGATLAKSSELEKPGNEAVGG
jgi:hypothetical protein